MTTESGHLLVADDNSVHRDILSRRLANRGHTVSTATNGRDALDKVAKTRFDLVLLDVTMPVVDGHEALAELRKKYTVAELPVIMVTANSEPEHVVKALELGANDYVTKPFDFPVLHSRVETHLKLKRLSDLKTSFLQIASHDIKSPLGVIMCTGGMLEHQLIVGDPVTDDVVEEIGWIMKAAKTIKRMVLDFLDFQALTDGQLPMKLAPTGMDAIADRVVEANRGYAEEKGIAMRIELGSTPDVRVDGVRIEQVMQNLVNNAIKFSEADSAIVVRTAAADDGGVEFAVEDAGPGLTDEDLEKLFTKYARLSNAPTGGEKSSGVGLAICRQLIDLHGGEIGARNNAERGATFWFRLPPEAAAQAS